MVMDVYNDYLLVTYHPFDVHIYHVKVSGDLTPSSTPDIQVMDRQIILRLLSGFSESVL